MTFEFFSQNSTSYRKGLLTIYGESLYEQLYTLNQQQSKIPSKNK